jgi:hypothetical protein
MNVKNFEVSGQDLVEVLFRHFPGETEENHEQLIRITGILFENRTEYKSRALSRI